MFQPTIISTSQSDDRIIIRFLMSRNKRNDYRLNWNSFKWKPTKRRLIRKERCLAIRCGRYFEKRSTSLFGECCSNLMVNMMVNLMVNVMVNVLSCGWKGGRPSMHWPAFVSDCWMTMTVSEWEKSNSDAGTPRHQSTSFHSNSS